MRFKKFLLILSIIAIGLLILTVVPAMAGSTSGHGIYID